MQSKLVPVLLVTIAAFAVADLTRAGATALTSYFANSAADSTSRIAATPAPTSTTWKTASGD